MSWYRFFITSLFLCALYFSVFAESSEPHVSQINGVSVPSDFPEIQVTQVGETAPGKIFIGSTFTDESIGNYLIICENDGTPYFYQKFDEKSDGRGSGEFQVQPTGVLTAFLFDPQIYIVYDSTFTIIDTLQCGNGYATDPHELTLLPNGHALLIAKEFRQVDMSQLVDGGDPNATVLGNHIQELDENKNVVFEWKCWDFFNIEDAIHENLRASWIDYVHMNSVYPDYDGHLIISSRHLSEITKINRDTGEIMWRLGGVNNQFDFINDSIEISYQHHARPVLGKPNSYTFFDNGNHRDPRFSRAVEYELDLKNMTAEKTWEYRLAPDRYSFMLGSVQRFLNENTLINWSTWPPLFANEVDAAGNLVYEIKSKNVSTDRVRRYPWHGIAAKPYLIAEARTDGVLLIFNKFGDQSVQKYVVYGGTSIDNLAPMDTTLNTFSYLTDLQNNSTYFFQVSALDSSGKKSSFSNRVEHHVSIREPGDNLIINGDFGNGESNWTFVANDEAEANVEVIDNVCKISIDDGGAELSKVQLIQDDIPLIQGRRYRFEFDGWAESNRVVEAKITRIESQGTNYSKTVPMEFKRSQQRYSFDFEMTASTDPQARVIFNFGLSNADCYIDNVSLVLQTPTRVESQTIQDIQLQNFPNPFNAFTTISYRLEQAGNVQLDVYNVLGALKASWQWERSNSGIHNHTIDASSWSSGIYFYELTLTHPNRTRLTERKKLVLIK